MKSLWQKFSRFDGKYNIVIDLALALVVSFAACFLFGTGNSPLFRIASYDFINKDSNFFYFEAVQAIKGYKPYIDIYDHKGLYHLGISMLGVLMGGHIGILILEGINATITNFLVLRSVRMICENKPLPRLFCLVGAVTLTSVLCSGNLEGEWLMPYVATNLFFFIKGLRTNEVKYFYIGSFFMGLGVGVSFNSRPLDSFWCTAGAVYLFIDTLKKKTWKKLLLCALISIVGFLVPFLIIWPIAAINGFFNEMIDALYVHNIFYASRTNLVLDTWVNRAVIFGVAGLFVFFYFIQRKEDKEVAFYFLILTLVAATLLFLVARYPNYYWSGFPFYEITITYFLYTLRKRYKYGKANFRGFASLAAGCVSIWTVVLFVGYYGSGILDFRYQDNLLYRDQIVQTIPEEVRHSPGAVLGIEVDSCVYEYGEIDPAYRYFCNQAWWSIDRPEIAVDVKAYLSGSSKPQYVLFGKWDLAEEIYGETLRAHYEMLDVQNAKFSIWKAL